MTYETLNFALRDGVAWITIDRPAQFNALTLAAMRELQAVAARCSTDDGVRAVVLTGAGDKAFCAGGDVGAFAENADALPPLLTEMTASFHLAISRFSWMRAPLIAAVNGVAAGAGVSLVAAADLVIAVEGAKFTSAYTQIGLTPDGSSSYFLSRILGPRRALEFYLTNRTLTAREALEWGLVNRVVAAAEFHDAVTKLARQLAAGPTRAYGGAKKLVQMGMNDTLESQMERETRMIVGMGATADAREGVRAFIEKRRPHFAGS
ncbi:MAG TPA: enoyl-CoA hydratase-related protein [Stellaceae bacterium]|nr:enoyl-CoA hydratase-related protein [Stellaceae bacterium]